MYTFSQNRVIVPNSVVFRNTLKISPDIDNPLVSIHPFSFIEAVSATSVVAGRASWTV
jgi:hypothetical protein